MTRQGVSPLLAAVVMIIVALFLAGILLGGTGGELHLLEIFSKDDLRESQLQRCADKVAQFCEDEPSTRNWVTQFPDCEEFQGDIRDGTATCSGG